MTDPLDQLAAFNRDEWADKPFLLELRGGPRNGKQFRWHDLPMMWREPLPAENQIASLLSQSMLPTTPTQLMVADYRETGSVTDDGVHIYEFDRFE